MGTFSLPHLARTPTNTDFTCGDLFVYSVHKQTCSLCVCVCVCVCVWLQFKVVKIQSASLDFFVFGLCADRQQQTVTPELQEAARRIPEKDKLFIVHPNKQDVDERQRS